jgi:hypothetical protein
MEEEGHGECYAKYVAHGILTYTVAQIRTIEKLAM